LRSTTSGTGDEFDLGCALVAATVGHRAGFSTGAAAVIFSRTASHVDAASSRFQTRHDGASTHHRDNT
jgi:hypothetical protein